MITQARLATYAANADDILNNTYVVDVIWPIPFATADYVCVVTIEDVGASLNILGYPQIVSKDRFKVRISGDTGVAVENERFNFHVVAFG